MSAKEIARSGLLAAAAVALLYIGGAAPYLGPAACIVAGVTSAVPLLRRARVRTAVLLYIAAALLGALVAPRKSVVAAYALLTGLYPIVKYGVEARLPRQVQTGVKLAYFNLVLAEPLFWWCAACSRMWPCPALPVWRCCGWRPISAL